MKSDPFAGMRVEGYFLSKQEGLDSEQERSEAGSSRQEVGRS
jgi:hypothetical protein